MKELKSTVQKTFALLEHFTVQKNEWGVTELANAMNANKSTVYRFLSDLQKSGIVYKNPVTEQYSLGIKLYELGNRVKLKSAFVDKTHPILMDVANDISETVHIGVLKQNQVFYVDKVESPQGLKISTQIGTYKPLYATALGKVMLGFLPSTELELVLEKIMATAESFTKNTITDRAPLLQELETIRNCGYALDREESEIGLICVGIPVYNQKNEIIASLSASGPANRFEEDHVMDYVQLLKKGAELIKERIGFFKP